MKGSPAQHYIFAMKSRLAIIFPNLSGHGIRPWKRVKLGDENWKCFFHQVSQDADAVCAEIEEVK